MPPIAARHRSASLATFTIRVDGEELPGTYGLASIDIIDELNRIPTAHLVLYDGSAAAQDFELSSGDLLVPGKTLEIEGGYNNAESRLFKGMITSQRIQVRRGADSLLHVEARSPAFRMTLARRSRYFADVTDGDVFQQIVSEYGGLSAETDTTDITYPEIVQYRVTDWDFIVSRAEKVGLCCLVDGDTFRIFKPDPGQQPALTVTYGVDVFELDLEMDARTQYPTVRALAWDAANQEVISSEVEDVTTPDQGNLTGSALASAAGAPDLELRHSGSPVQQEVDAWANAGMLKSRFAKVIGTVRVQGTEVVRPGGTCELKGVGERMKGVAFVSGVRQVFGRGEWETSIQVGLPRQWHHERFDLHEPDAAGFHPAAHGLHTATVTQLESDPEGENRIQVRLPLISTNDPGTWARVSTLDAGADRGSFFLPEVGDEVLVGFLNDDPHEPVVLGMLHSSGKAAPLTASDDNHQKGFVTRSGMKVLFDDEKVSVTISTPKGKQMVVDEDDGSLTLRDEFGNTIVLDDAGISIESTKDLKLKAAAKVSIEGLDINARAGASATLEGSAGATLKSGGATQVKGSIVQIN